LPWTVQRDDSPGLRARPPAPPHDLCFAPPGNGGRVALARLRLAALAWEASLSPALLRRNAGVLEDLAVTLGVGLVDGVELGRRGWRGNRTLRQQLLPDVRHLENLRDVLADLGQDRLRRSGRCKHAEPGLVFVVR